MRRVAATCLLQLEANTPGALASGNPEFVHQMRVGLRRLRCAMRFFDDTSARRVRKQLGPALRELARALGEQRDWDVFIDTTLPQLPLAAPVRAGALRQRSAARRRARDLIAQPEHAALLGGLATWLAGPALSADAAAGLRRHVQARLKDLYRRVRRGARRFAGLDEAERHQVRIDVKRLRYAVDAAGALFEPIAVKRFTESLESLQDLLGDLTDINTARILLGKLEVGKVGLGFAQQRLAQRESDLLAQAPARFAGAMAVAGFWKHRKKGEQHV